MENIETQSKMKFENRPQVVLSRNATKVGGTRQVVSLGASVIHHVLLIMLQLSDAFANIVECPVTERFLRHRR